MSIRVKLLLSYAAMLIVPLILLLVTALLLVIVFQGDLKNIRDFYHIADSKTKSFKDSIDNHLFRELKRTAESSPDILTSPAYLEQIKEELTNLHSGIIIRKNNETLYSSESEYPTELLQQLPAFEKEGHHGEDVTARIGYHLYAIEQYDFIFQDKSRGSFFLVGDVNPLAHFARRFFPLLFISLLVILVLTNTLLTYLVSRSIIRPLLSLKKAAEQIKDGNLDFHIQPTSKDEIGQLCISFEEMRQKLKESVETQLQYEENRKELISNISHDLKTPITAIKGYVEGIQDGIADSPEKMKKYVQTIYAKAEGMDHLIDELFLFSKLDLKRLPFHLEHVDISAFLEDCLDELHFDLEKKGITLQADISLLQHRIVTADREKLKRVVTNILENSFKYMDKPDKIITIRSKETAKMVTLMISDNGQGIEPDALPFIFERFYRAEQSRNTATGGSGLGLAIAKQIIEGHGGEIGAMSKKGTGTTIYFSLPKRMDKEGGTFEKNTDY